MYGDVLQGVRAGLLELGSASLADSVRLSATGWAITEAFSHRGHCS